MASFSLARRSQPGAQSNGSGRLSFGAPRNAQVPSDPLQPLRAMADRVGKEVEKFAERVDHWHTHGNESAASKYQTTVKMVGKFRDVAESHVRELKKTNDAENKGELNKSVRRRIRTMAEAPDATGQGDLGQSFQSSFLSVETNAGPDSASLQELRQWQAELATWELLRIIIDHYHPEPGTDIEAEKESRLKEAVAPKRYSSNNEIWERFLLEDDQAKEKALILRWLEQTAQSSESDIDSITAELEAQSGKGAHTWTSGWLDTKAKIKQVKRVEGSDQPLKPTMANIKTADRTQNLVTQLDPDAPARQKRALEKSDEYYERALWMVCYEMMRRGVPWKDIYEWSLERNEAWRGVSIGAATETHPKGCPNVGGQTVGYLFRRMCFYAARGARIPYEGAVYGLLSGDLKQVQAVCRTWDDHLHAHYNALLLSRFDSYLQQNHSDRVTQSLSQKFVFQDAVSNIGSWEDSPSAVINMLKQHKATSSQSILPIKLIQGALISGNIEELVYSVGIALADMFQKDERTGNLMVHPDSDEKDRGPKPAAGQQATTAEKYYQTLATDPHAFRILVHIFIALREGMGMLSTQDVSQWFAMDNVIAAYIEFLRVTKRIQLIPLYAAQLDEERAYHCLARVLPDIKNSEEQQRCIALLGEYRVNAIEVVSQSFTFAFNHSGFIHFDNDGFSVITDPITRFQMVEAADQVLWPGVRVKAEFGGATVERKEENIIEALHWYHYLGKEDHMTFEHLKNALTIFLLNGRLAAAERIVTDLNVESLSLSRTEALCGYPFDFMQPEAEEQDERQLHAFRESITGADRSALPSLSTLPDAEGHEGIVLRLREHSAAYYNLQQIVRLLVMFREWREEEEQLIKIRGSSAKVNTKRIKELLDAIQTVFDALIPSLNDSHSPNTPDMVNLKRAYVPEIIIAYLSVLQSASFFLNRDLAIKAMEVATLVADEDNAWLQELFLQTGRMSELVDTLAQVSKAMLKLNEHDGKKKETKKRGNKGETLRIWDLNTVDRM